MEDEQFRVPIVRMIKLREFDRASERLRGMKEQIQAWAKSEWGCTFEGLYDAFQKGGYERCEQLQAALCQAKRIMEMEVVMEKM